MANVDDDAKKGGTNTNTTYIAQKTERSAGTF